MPNDRNTYDHLSGKGADRRRRDAGDQQRHTEDDARVVTEIAVQTARHLTERAARRQQPAGMKDRGGEGQHGQVDRASATTCWIGRPDRIISSS
jgi:hypothetical protein